MGRQQQDRVRPARVTRTARIDDLTVVRDGRTILAVEHLEIASQDRWVLLGPNGSGKSTLLSVLAGRLWPTAGSVELLGERLGRVDLRDLRPRLGLLSSSLARQLRTDVGVHDVVVTGLDGALEPWWREYPEAAHRMADRLLDEVGAGHLSRSSFGVISDGERAKVLLARLLIAEPELLCLDEPAAGLDLGAREQLLQRLAHVFDRQASTAVVLVTHHLEEIPPGLTHAAILSAGRVLVSGPVDVAISSHSISTAFDVDVEVERHDGGRYSARALT